MSTDLEVIYIDEVDYEEYFYDLSKMFYDLYRYFFWIYGFIFNK